MKVTLALIADYANVTKEGKLNVMGIFDRIWSENFPARHTSMHLVMGFEASRVESENKFTVEVFLVDADGQKILGLKGPLAFDKSGKEPGDTIKRSQILALKDIIFPKPGNYSFDILVNLIFNAIEFIK